MKGVTMTTKKPHRLLTEEEIEFLAKSYIKLKSLPTYKNLSTTFHKFIDTYLEKELLTMKKMGLLK
jgi:hypothetical protein